MKMGFRKGIERAYLEEMKPCSSTFNLNSFNQNKNTCSTLNSDNFSVRENTLFVCDFDLSAQW